MQASPTDFMHALIRKEARSLLQYIGESYPWASHERMDALESLLHIAKHEAHQIDRLARWCIKNKLGNPPLGAYPQSFMGINFSSLEFLLPLLINDHKKRIADLEWSLLSAPADAHGLIKDLVGAKKKHLEKLQSFLVPA